MSLQAALHYANMGFSVIPVGKDKKPFVKWEPYQKQKPDKNQITYWWTKHPDAGVAIITGSISGICVVDIDTEEGEFAFKEKIGEVHCPTAISPRGGKHLYFRDFGAGNKTGFLPGVDFRGEGGYIIAPPSPGPNGKKYAWIKGLRITTVTLPPAPSLLVDIINIYSNIYSSALELKTERDTIGQAVTLRDISFSEGRRDESIFHITWLLHKGGMPLKEIEQFLLVICRKLCEPPMEESVIPVKIKSAIDRLAKREGNLAQEIKDLISVTSGDISVTFVDKELNIVTKRDIDNRRKIIQRFIHKDNLLEATKKAGVYRVIKKDCDTIDWKSASSEPLNIEMPFGLEAFVRLFPKNIIVCAGSQNAGKTAFALNLAFMNRDKFKVRYFSSEMGPEELKKRLELFECEPSEWDKVSFFERSTRFADVIEADALNIIDYLEISSEFWLVAEEMRMIYEKLENGLAVICLQKTAGKSAGRGGDFGLEKPRLYLNLDPDPPRGGKITIAKAKSWAANTLNPNGLQLNYKIVNGCKLIKNGDWNMGEY